ncbi:MAG: DUF2975 domain-containing protein [Cellulomonas sp.]|uniref:DUF2975 domain-containing protein n=1 Tax=Cellulomonas sp. TaxID=40001 RepID=UPI0019E47E9D|nr:DUF2975 domain-containing protein [Cellulomonas sp.]MBF0686692.1 DUF2975 domain-containing protein [Cellulomonas sp.]
MTPTLRHSLRIVLVALLLGSLLLQALLPLIADEAGGGYTETAGLVLPYAASGIASVACLQVLLGAAWWLVTRVDRDEILTPRALRGVDVATGAVVLATVLAAAPVVHLLFVVGVGGPGVLLALLACLAGGVGLTCGFRVLRSVLVAATADRTELAAVV